MIELDKESAIDLNDMLEFADSLPTNMKFDVGFYTSCVLDSQTKENYTYYTSLLFIAKRLMNKYNAQWVSINEMGEMWSNWTIRSFLNQGGFVTILEKENDERRLNSNIILTNKASILNIGATILFGIIVTTIQIRTYTRDERKDLREERQLIIDSLKQEQQSRHDTIYEKYLLRKAQEIYQSDTASRIK